WTALVTFPLMTAVQFLCAKIGMVGGMGLAGGGRRHYSRKLLYALVTLLVFGNTIHARVDICAIAAGVDLLGPLPLAVWVLPVTLVLLVLQIWGSSRLIARCFKWLTLTLLAYIGSSLLARPDWGSVLWGTFVPEVRFDAEFLAMLVALLGTTISPY